MRLRVSWMEVPFECLIKVGNQRCVHAYFLLKQLTKMLHDYIMIETDIQKASVFILCRVAN